MAHLTKLLLDQLELPLKGRYSIRVDRTIVIEPSIQLTEDTFRRIMKTKQTIEKICIKNPDVIPFLEYHGPYTFKRVHGILVFDPCAS